MNTGGTTQTHASVSGFLSLLEEANHDAHRAPVQSWLTGVSRCALVLELGFDALPFSLVYSHMIITGHNQIL